MTDSARYLGIDLAWSGVRPSGVSVVDAAGRVLHDDVLASDELPGWIRAHRGERSVLAIDAPLLFRPSTPTLRPAERALHKRFGRYHAGPYPGGPGSMAMRGRSVSPAFELVGALGYETNPGDRTAPHRAIEVFPAPAWITLGGLADRIVYKRGTLVDRRRGLTRARDVLLAAIGPGATLGPSLESRWATAVTGADLKAVEDLVDARLCAHIALLWGMVGGTDWAECGGGSFEDGYVVVPPGPVAG